MPGFLSGGLTVLIRGEARMLSASIREIHSFIHSFYFAINQKYNNSIQKYIKDNIHSKHFNSPILIG